MRFDSDDESDTDEAPCCSEELVKSNKRILRNIVICQATYYAVYYVVTSLMHGILRIDTPYDGKEPFDFVAMSSLNFSRGSKESVGSFLSLEITYFITTIIISIFLHRRIWDYAVTITAVHILLSCIVMGQFPMVWQWWGGIGIALLWMMVMGESISFYRRRRSGRRSVDNAINLPVKEDSMYVVA